MRSTLSHSENGLGDDWPVGTGSVEALIAEGRNAFFGSTSMPFIGRRSIITPPSQTAWPATAPPAFRGEEEHVVRGTLVRVAVLRWRTSLVLVVCGQR